MLRVDPGGDSSAAVTIEVELRPDGASQEFAAGYQLGFFTGHEIGWSRGFAESEEEVAAAWHTMWIKVRDVLRQPTFAELQRRRGAPR